MELGLQGRGALVASEGGFAPLSISPSRLSRAALEPRHPAGGPNLPPGKLRAQSPRSERCDRGARRCLGVTPCGR